MPQSPQFMNIAHLDLSVPDVEKSATWYAETLGLRKLRRADLDNRVVIMLLHEPTGLIIGLNQHPEPTAESFDEHSPGLDHVGFGVRDRDELDRWQLRLAELGVEHSPVTDSASGSGAALVFRDPDNIQLEFWWTRPR